MCYFPPVSSSSNPLRTVPLPGSPHAAASLLSAGRELHTAVPPDSMACVRFCSRMVVIVEHLLPLPPQNTCARCCQQCRHQDDGQPRLADHPQHTFRALAHGSGQLPVVVEDGGADSLLAFAQFRSDRLSCSLNAAFSISPVPAAALSISALSPSPALKDCS